jgi:radical SAM protein with 4Fe4S-binding SPASM domain
VKNLPFPTFFTLEIESRCNNRCPGCGNVFDSSSGMVSKHLTLDEWDSVLKKISSIARFVKVTGGEPTLSPVFFSLLERLENYKIPFFIFTNGRWRDRISIVKAVKSNSQFRGLLISLHGADSVTHSEFSGIEQSFEETVESIKYASSHLVNVAVNTVITSKNFQQIEAIVSFVESVGAKSVSFSRYIGLNLPQISPNTIQLLSAIKSIEHMRFLGHRVCYGPCIPQCFAFSGAISCTAGIASCAIDPWGNVKPCAHSRSYGGNIREKELLTIWNSSSFESWRNILPTDCGTCSMLDACGGGCRAQMLLISSAKDPLMNKPLKSIPLDEYKFQSTYRPKFLGEVIRETNRKFFIIKGGRVRMINQSAKKLLDLLDGDLSLEQIKDIWGHSGLNLIVSLYREGYIQLESQYRNEQSEKV